MTKKVIFGVLVVAVLVAVMLLWRPGSDGGGSGGGASTAEAAALAACLTDKGVRMYGSYTCSACKAQIKSFGEAFENIDYVECHPNGPNPQTQLCLTRSISKTPTWILEQNGEEVERLVGFQPFEDLAAFAGCGAEADAEQFDGRTSE